MKGMKQLLLSLSLVFSGTVVALQTTAPPVIVYADQDDSNTAVQNVQKKEEAKKEEEKNPTSVSTTERDSRDSKFGDIIEKFMEIKVDIGNLTFDFQKLELSFENFIKMENIKTWTVGNVNIYKVFKDGIYETISAIGVSLATLFCLVALIREGLAFDRIDWRRVLVQVVKTVIVIYFIENAWNMLEAIGSISTDVTTHILDKVNIDVGKTLPLGTIMRNIIVFIRLQDTGTWGNSLGFVYEIITFLGMLLVGIQYYKTILDVVLKVFQRLFKLLFGLAISPIPIATTLSDSNTSTQGLVKYCIWVFGVYFEGMVMLVAVKLFIALWAGLLSGITSTANIGTIIAALVVGVGLVNGLFSTIIEAGQRVLEQFSR